MPKPTSIQSTTQEHLDIEDIVDNLIILKDGSVALVITTTAVNFGLLSESEQDATIYAYAALLNSLTFAIQIFIRSNQKDITAYEKLLAEQELKSANPENKDRIKKYREFIEETVRQRNVLDKKFYLVIPYSVLELGVAKSASAVMKSGTRALPFPKDYILGRAKITLEPKRDHLIHQLNRLGLRARQSTTKELIQLMFEIYNPDSAQGQILTTSEEFETPIVEPAMAFQEAPQPTNHPTTQSTPAQTPSPSVPHITSDSRQPGPKQIISPQPENQTDQTPSDPQAAINQALEE